MLNIQLLGMKDNAANRIFLMPEGNPNIPSFTVKGGNVFITKFFS